MSPMTQARLLPTQIPNTVPPNPQNSQKQDSGFVSVSFKIQQSHFWVFTQNIWVSVSDLYAPLVTAALLTITKFGNNLSIHQQMNIKYHVSVCVCVSYSALKRKGILLFVIISVELKSIMLSEISQTQRQTQHIFTCICNRKYFNS